jgi:hypothetical protein
MKFEIIETNSNKLANNNACYMVLSPTGKLLSPDVNVDGGMWLKKTIGYEARFPEHEALKAELEKWRKFYDDLPSILCTESGGQICCEFYKGDIASECGLDIPK